MNWVAIAFAIVDALRPALEECLQPTPEGAQTLREYGPRVRLNVYRGARRQARSEGKTFLEARRLAEQAVEEGRVFVMEATDAELIGLIEDMHDMCEDCGSDK